MSTILAALALLTQEVAPSRAAPTFEALHVAADELPKGWALEKELACVSPQPATLFEDDLYSQLLPKARKQDFQTIAGPASRGSILYFDWGERLPDAIEEFVPSLLFGGPEKATAEHPEQIVRAGGVLAIVSFPLDAPERKWVVERLRRRFGLRLPRDFGALKPVMATLFQKVDQGEGKAGLEYATKHQKELADVSFAAYLEGELATLAKEWPRAESAYARALELDRRSDPLPTDGAAWAARDGLGTAFYFQAKHDDAIRELRLAAKFAAELRRPKDQAHCLYNVACSLALSGKSEEALATLKEALALDPERKAAAARDADFQSLAARPEFHALVK